MELPQRRLEGGSQESVVKIVSWNINGIRTVKNLKTLLDSFDADIICLQETKVTRDMIDEPTALVEGYNAYFAFSRTKSGYSGVATYCREHSTPLHAEEGLTGILQTPKQPDMIGFYGDIEYEFVPQDLKKLDAEGRAVITQHKIEKKDGIETSLTLFNVYCPRADPERSDRLQYKLQFYRLLEMRAAAVRRSGSHVVVVGDINTSHQHIDRCENIPQDEFESNQGRQWLNSLIVDVSSLNNARHFENDAVRFKMVDSFRYFHPNQVNAFTCWNTMINARATNYGSRIDYVLVDCSIIKDMIDSAILGDVMGSDHCPVVGVFNFCIRKAIKCPSTCIKNFPEFAGVQQKLSSFLIKKSDVATNEDTEGNAVKKICYGIGSNYCKIQECETNQTPKPNKAKVQKNISSFFSKPTTAPTSQVSSLDLVPSVEKTSETVEDLLKAESTVHVALPAKNTAVAVWRSMLSGPRPSPLCKGHKEPCVERTVKKKGPNFNKKFFCCARGEGSKLDANARCDHFEWIVKK